MLNFIANLLDVEVCFELPMVIRTIQLSLDDVELVIYYIDLCLVELLL